jgi:hypothetical protein
VVTRYHLRSDISSEFFFRRAFDQTRKSNRNVVSKFAGVKFPSGSLIVRTAKVIENSIKTNGKSDSINTWQFDSLVSQRKNPLEIGRKVISYLQQLISWRCFFSSGSLSTQKQSTTSFKSLPGLRYIKLYWYLVTVEIIPHLTTLVVTDTDYIDICK